MRWRPWMWLTLSMACFLAAVYFWQLGDKWAAQKNHPPVTPDTNQIQPAGSPSKPAPRSQVQLVDPRLTLLSEPGHVNSLPTRHPAKTNRVSALAYRLTNTTQPLRALIHSDTAVLLGNALIDTANAGRPAIPDS